MSKANNHTVARPTFDPEISQVLEDRRAELLVTMTPEEIQPLRDRLVPLTLDEIAQSGRYVPTEHAAVGPGGEVALILLRPAEPAGDQLPVLLHLHGGGMVLGDARSDGPVMAELAEEIGAAVLSVEYRLAPEHPYPAALEDAYAALVWLADEAENLGLDRSRIIVSGASAGGGLAAALAQFARDCQGPALLGQLLICPMLDDRNDSLSARQMQGQGVWDRTANATGWAAYLGAAVGGPEVTGHAAAARAVDLSGLAPAFVDVGSAETFRDECVAYAARIWACGGEAELHVWPGGCHGFDQLAPTALLSIDARTSRKRWLKRLVSHSARVVE